METKKQSKPGHDCRMHRRGLCDNTAKLGQLMCPRCWFLVPRELRARINALWAEGRNNVLRLPPEYFDAVREAEASVAGRLEAS
jgi:hypothetical protein